MLSKGQLDQVLCQAYSLCAQIMPIRQCRLYVSYARGDCDPESNVDILMSVDLTEAELKQHRHTVACINSKLSVDYDVTVSITIKPAENVARYSSFVPYYQNVIREGQLYAG